MCSWPQRSFPERRALILPRVNHTYRISNGFFRRWGRISRVWGPILYLSAERQHSRACVIEWLRIIWRRGSLSLPVLSRRGRGGWRGGDMKIFLIIEIGRAAG